MRQAIIDTALKCDADVVGFAPASRFDKNDAVFKLFPDAKTVIGLGFRVLRGAYFPAGNPAADDGFSGPGAP